MLSEENKNLNALLPRGLAMNSTSLKRKRLVAAKRADRWYSDRLKENYTFEDNEFSIMMFREELAKRNMAEVDRALAIDEMKYEGVVEKSNLLFSSELVFLSEVRNPETGAMGMLSKAYIDEYIGPLVDCLSQMEFFIDKISGEQRGFAHLPSNFMMDRIFLSHFGGIEGFVNYQNKYNHAFLMYNEVKRDLGLISSIGFDISKSIWQSLAPSVEYVTRKVFLDLRGAENE